MGFSTSDVVPFTQARANLSELADQAKLFRDGDEFGRADAAQLRWSQRASASNDSTSIVSESKIGWNITSMSASKFAPRNACSMLRRRRISPSLVWI